MYDFLLGHAENDVHRLYFRRPRAPSLPTWWAFRSNQAGWIDNHHHRNKKPCHVFSKVSELGSLLRKQPRSQSINPDIIGVYFKRQGCTLCLLVSLAITTFAASNEPVLVLFQMRVSASHPVKAYALARIWAEIPANLKQTPPILVFVVLVDVAKTFCRQTITPRQQHLSQEPQPTTPPISTSEINTFSRSAMKI